MSSASQPCRLPVLGGNFLVGEMGRGMDIPNKYPLYKVYMGLIMNGSIPEIKGYQRLLCSFFFYFYWPVTLSQVDVKTCHPLSATVAHHLNLVRFVTFKYFGSLGISWSSDKDNGHFRMMECTPPKTNMTMENNHLKMYLL